MVENFALVGSSIRKILQEKSVDHETCMVLNTYEKEQNSDDIDVEIDEFHVLQGIGIGS